MGSFLIGNGDFSRFLFIIIKKQTVLMFCVRDTNIFLQGLQLIAQRSIQFIPNRATIIKVWLVKCLIVYRLLLSITNGLFLSASIYT